MQGWPKIGNIKFLKALSRISWSGCPLRNRKT